MKPTAALLSALLVGCVGGSPSEPVQCTRTDTLQLEVVMRGDTTYTTVVREVDICGEAR